jgi:PAS domain S-box-containing protein
MVSHTDIILDSIADGVFTVDPAWRITSFNAAAERITGIPREEAIGRICAEVFKATICESACVLRKTIETGEPIVNREVTIVRADGEQVTVSVSTALLRDQGGMVIGGVETFRDLSEVEELRKELTQRHTFADIISKDHGMRRLFDILPEIAESESTVLIEGESGTGKELFARAIHSLSPRCDAPLVAVNCGALPDTLLEAELFGYKAGAFTDARHDKPGRFALAEEGTIFLDEIGDISPAMQVRLLRVLQERVYEPLGATEPVKANVRVIAATNRDLDDLVAGGTFRRDLYYRINVVRLVIPPIRRRRGDIPLLVDHFVERFNKLKKKYISGVSASAMQILMNHDFPGNVRELENIIEHAFVLCRGGVIGIEHLPRHLKPVTGAPAGASVQSLDELEARFLLDVLRRNNWNRQEAAKELGIHKTTLWRKIKRLGLDIPPIDGRKRP